MSAAVAVRDALATKAARLERCIERAKAEYAAASDFATDYTRQDAAILNIQRACELAIDMANIVVSDKGLGLPDAARDAFRLLEQHGLIDAGLTLALNRMVGFRNIAVHQYDTLNLNIVTAVIQLEIDVLRRFSSTLINHYPQPA